MNQLGREEGGPEATPTSARASLGTRRLTHPLAPKCASPRLRSFLSLAIPLLGALGFGLLPGRAAPPTPPPAGEVDEELAERRILAERLVRENCLICHSQEMFARQRLTSAQWKAEVEKMVGWGAPLSKEQEPAVIELLADEYSPEKPLTPPARISFEEAMATIRPEPGAPASDRGDSARGAVLFAAQCATCHGPTAFGGDLGPNLVEKPVLLQPSEYHRIVRQGRNRMPGFQSVLKPEQEEDLLAWLRRQRYSLAGP
jgi:ubiquinol-cytochrome c reductase cytochrome c subunit